MLAFFFVFIRFTHIAFLLSYYILFFYSKIACTIRKNIQHYSLFFNLSGEAFKNASPERLLFIEIDNLLFIYQSIPNSLPQIATFSR